MKATYKHFRISSSYTGSKPSSWDSKNWNHHNITVFNTITKTRCRFDFWASIVEPEIMTRESLVHSFYCFLSDAISGLERFEEFCSTMGYDTDSMTAYRAHKACQRSLRKAERVINEDLYSVLHGLSEVAA